MKFLKDLGFEPEEIKSIEKNIPKLIKEQINNSQELVKANIQYLKSAIDNMDINKTGNGAGQLTVPDFENMSIILPDLPKQEEFSRFVSLIYSKLEKSENKLYDLDNKKEDLLKKYFE